MKFVLLTISILFLTNCSKPKTVLICGDHICVNKTEAEQYFQENLSIEVKVVDKKVESEIDLVELNLKESRNGIKKISILSKKEPAKNLKILTSKEISSIKKKVKNKNKEKKIAQKIIKKKQIIDNNENKIDQKKIKNIEKDFLKKREKIVDICLILEKCNIDEISKYLLKQGKKKRFPDITIRQ